MPQVCWSCYYRTVEALYNYALYVSLSRHLNSLVVQFFGLLQLRRGRFYGLLLATQFSHTLWLDINQSPDLRIQPNYIPGHLPYY